ncbi:MAG TPA: tetratricopeptide repeat protein [Candidatus Binataceae bacterium]|nr:tetratricopeptide repeat protein [Candidatus Binataceae bacterium]
MRGKSTAGKGFLAIIKAAALLYLIFQGAEIAIVVVRDLGPVRFNDLGEGRFTRFDPLLGWAAIPGTRMPNLFGPGLDLTIDAEGFRGQEDIPVKAPAGKFRVICSGDSFTFGYVDDKHTWCQLLAGLDPRLTPVNMGYPAYGNDQAYLWYMRDGSKIEHSIHIFAFITDDFLRMQSWSHSGLKPLLRLKGGRLVAVNVPLHERWFRVLHMMHDLSELKLVRLGAKIGELLHLSSASGGAAPDDPGAEGVFDASVTMFEELARSNAQQRSTLVLVYLPEFDDYSNHQFDAFRARFKAAVAQKGIYLIDLVDAIRTLPMKQASDFFIPWDTPLNSVLAAGGHYTVAGNEWVARSIYDRIKWAPSLPGPGASVPADTMAEWLKRLDRADTNAYVDLAFAEDAAGDAEGAKAALMWAASLHGSAEVVALADAQLRLRHGDGKRAQGILRELLLRHPNNVRALDALGAALLSEQNYGEALTVYRRALTIDPHAPELHYKIASLLHQLGREREARDECSIALAQAPGDSNARALMAAIERSGQ